MVTSVETYVLRVWLPDRPGALGAVASRIGAVKGDVVGIEILETGSGQAVDELVVQLPDATLVDLLIAEVRQVDGAHVEEVRSIGTGGHDPLGAVLETTALLVGAHSQQALLDVVVDRGCAALGSTWVAVVDAAARKGLTAAPGAPSPEWLAAFVAGAQPASDDGEASGDVIWTPLPATDLALVAGRERSAWRQRERRQLRALAGIIAARWSELPEA